MRSASQIRIVTDSSCDLPKSEVDRLGVIVVPLAVSFGSEVLLDGDLTHDEYWERTKGPFWPTSSRPSVGAFEEAFAPLVEGDIEATVDGVTCHARDDRDTIFRR